MMLKTFLRRIFEVAKRGDATEESYYSCLEELLSNYAASIKRKQTHVTTIPKRLRLATRISGYGMESNI